MQHQDIVVSEDSTSIQNSLGLITINTMSLSDTQQELDGYVAERHLPKLTKPSKPKRHDILASSSSKVDYQIATHSQAQWPEPGPEPKIEPGPEPKIEPGPESELEPELEHELVHAQGQWPGPEQVQESEQRQEPEQASVGSAKLILDKLINNSQEQESGDLLMAVLGVKDNDYGNNAAADAITAVPADAAAPFGAVPDGTVPSATKADGAAILGSEGPELSAEDLERFSKMSLKEGDLCPACSQGTLVLRKNDKVQFLGCSCYPSCKMRYFTAASSPVSTLKILKSLCPKCQSPLAVKKGRYGLFVGCSNYPDCNYTHKETEQEQAISCPICSKGTLEKRKTYNGRIFYGCSHYPKCNFLLSGVPVLRTCKECGFPLSFKKKVKAGVALVCGNTLCSSRRKRKYELIEP